MKKMTSDEVQFATQGLVNLINKEATRQGTDVTAMMRGTQIAVIKGDPHAPGSWNHHYEIWTGPEFLQIAEHDNGTSHWGDMQPVESLNKSAIEMIVATADGTFEAVAS